MRLSTVVGTIVGVGRFPVAPGTAASLVAAALWYLWHPPPWMQWSMCPVVIAIGIWSAGATARRAQQHDPPEVVIDEFAGTWLALAGLPKDPWILCIALLLFRLLDITKPPPIRYLERVPGGMGIMLDDIAAGLITRLVMAIGLFFVP